MVSWHRKRYEISPRKECWKTEEHCSKAQAIFKSKFVRLPRFVVEVLCTDFLTVCGVPRFFEAIWVLGLMKGTSLETIECPTQPDLVFQSLQKCAEVHRKRQYRGIRPYGLCSSWTSLYTIDALQLTVRDEDMTDLSHVAKCLKRKGEDQEPMKVSMTVSQSKKISKDAMEKLFAAMSELFGSMKEVEGTVTSLRSDMKGDVNNLETKMVNEGLQRKRDNQALEVKNEQGFQVRGR